MTPERDLELVKQLTEATREGRLSWHPTATIDEFTCSFKGRFSVLVGRYQGGGCYLRMVDADDREMLDIGGLTPVVDLWELARRAALKVDEAIEVILEDLKRA